MTATGEVVNRSPERNRERARKVQISNRDIIVDAVKVKAIAVFTGYPGWVFIRVPWLLLPEMSLSVVPVPSLKAYPATRSWGLVKHQTMPNNLYPGQVRLSHDFFPPPSDQKKRYRIFDLVHQLND